MRLKSLSPPGGSPAPGVIPETAHVDGGRWAAPAPEDRTPAAVESGTPTEARGDRLRRKAHRTRLHGYLFAGVALLVFLIALGASNTARVKVSWVFGDSHVALVWLVLFAAILGGLLGILLTAAFRWRTRPPRR